MFAVEGVVVTLDSHSGIPLSVTIPETGCQKIAETKLRGHWVFEMSPILENSCFYCGGASPVSLVT